MTLDAAKWNGTGGELSSCVINTSNRSCIIIFTACLNCRLSCYVEDHILGQEQAGFRESYNTIDHIFVLQLIIELYHAVHKLIYYAFIDNRKAFDYINRPLLWWKLLTFTNKICMIKQNLVLKSKSDYFPCNIGVRQGLCVSKSCYPSLKNEGRIIF